MIQYYIFAIIFTVIVACQNKDSIEPIEKGGYPYHYPKNSNPGLTPVEKPDIEDEYYEAPQMK